MIPAEMMPVECMCFLEVPDSQVPILRGLQM